MRILVVTDNAVQYDRMRMLVGARKRLSEFEFRHSIESSPMWNHADFKDKNLSIDVNKKASEICEEYDLVISMHCLQFFSAALVKGIRCVNIHPGYNPVNRGWYPQVFALVNGLPVGATIHEMDEKLDNGPIICRSLVPQYAWDISYSLYNRILEKEIELLDQHFEDIISGNYKTILPEKKGKLYLKKDFEKICEIDLSETGTFNDFYNRLRALSHGDFKNAYFIDPDSKQKIYLRIITETGAK